MQNGNYSSQNKYTDIINLPHHVSSTRPQMAISDRAAQFSPFAALTGYDAAIEETKRLTEEFIDITEERRIIINETLLKIKENIDKHPKVTVTYFQPDSKKEGGKYLSVTGQVKKIAEYTHTVIMTDDTEIMMERITEMIYT